MTARQLKDDDTEAVAVFAMQVFGQINCAELCGSWKVIAEKVCCTITRSKRQDLPALRVSGIAFSSRTAKNLEIAGVKMQTKNGVKPEQKGRLPPW